MWERHKDWRDSDYDPYRDDPVVYFSCTLSLFGLFALTVLVAIT